MILLSKGYQGLVDGGDNIREVRWEEVSGIIQLVGTCILHYLVGTNIIAINKFEWEVRKTGLVHYVLTLWPRFCV